MGSASLLSMVLGTMAGAAVGLGGYTFVYARGYSYAAAGGSCSS